MICRSPCSPFFTTALLAAHSPALSPPPPSPSSATATGVVNVDMSTVVVVDADGGGGVVDPFCPC